MTNERYKELMAQVGMPNSRSLLTALQQAVNETQQKEYKKAVLEEREACALECDELVIHAMRKHEIIAILECAKAIRARGEE